MRYNAGPSTATGHAIRGTMPECYQDCEEAAQESGLENISPQKLAAVRSMVRSAVKEWSVRVRFRPRF